MRRHICSRQRAVPTPRGSQRTESDSYSNLHTRTSSATGTRARPPLDHGRIHRARVKRRDIRELEDAAERRERQHAIGIVQSRAYPVCCCRERSEKQDPKDTDHYAENDVCEGRTSHRETVANALVAAVPTLCPTTNAQPCSKFNDPASSATSVVAAAAVELCMTTVMMIPIAPSTQGAAAPVPANESRSHEMPSSHSAGSRSR